MSAPDPRITKELAAIVARGDLMDSFFACDVMIVDGKPVLTYTLVGPEGAEPMQDRMQAHLYGICSCLREAWREAHPTAVDTPAENAP